VETKLVEIFSDASSHAVMRHPGRNFPGSLVQGNTLYNLVPIARDVLKRAVLTKDSELTESATELKEDLDERLAHYEAVLVRHGLSLPYVKSNDTSPPRRK
jgi:hypothetical protein